MLRAKTFRAMNGSGGAGGRGDSKVFVDVETGDSFVSTGESRMWTKRFRELDAEGALEVVKLMEGGEQVPIRSVQPSLLENLSTLPVQVEIGWAGESWRRCSNVDDCVVRRRQSTQIYSRLGCLDALSHGRRIPLTRIRHLGVRVRKSRRPQPIASSRLFESNVSRVLVQQMSRYDIFWHTHWSVKFNRMMDAFGTVPVIGFTGFPSSENFQNTRNFVLGSFFRVFLGQGNWITRVLTGREALITDDPNVVAQNLAAETNSFEASNLSQHGTFIGRREGE